MDSERPYACTWDACDKAFHRRSDLQRHARIHTGEKPYVCPEHGCGKAFIQRSALTVHHRVHTGEKPHVCQLCSRAFSDSSSLARHRRVHTGARPFKCKVAGCNKSFCRKTTLMKHHRRQHGIEDEDEEFYDQPEEPKRPQRYRRASTPPSPALSSDLSSVHTDEEYGDARLPCLDSHVDPLPSPALTLNSGDHDDKAGSLSPNSSYNDIETQSSASSGFQTVQDTKANPFYPDHPGAANYEVAPTYPPFNPYGPPACDMPYPPPQQMESGLVPYYPHHAYHRASLPNIHDSVSEVDRRYSMPRYLPRYPTYEHHYDAHQVEDRSSVESASEPSSACSLQTSAMSPYLPQQPPPQQSALFATGSPLPCGQYPQYAIEGYDGSAAYEMQMKEIHF